MSIKKRSVVRTTASSKVEEYDLPRWDKSGNLVAQSSPQPAVKKVEEVEEEIKPPTVAEIEAIREAAYNEGFEQGYASGLSQGEREGKKTGHKEGFDQGRQEGLEQGAAEGKQQALQEEQQKTIEKLQVLDVSSNQLKRQLSVEQAELEQALVGLSMRIAAQVIQDELLLSAEHIRPLVHAAVQSLPNPDEKLSLKLNPADIELVEGIAESHWQLEADEKIQRGGCQVKSGFSYVDYTLGHRFESATHLLMSQWQAAAEDKTKGRKSLSRQPLLNEHSNQLDTSTHIVVEPPETETDSAENPSGQMDGNSEPSEFITPSDPGTNEHSEPAQPLNASTDDLGKSDEPDSTE